MPRTKKTAKTDLVPREWGAWIEDADGNRVKDFPIHNGQAKALQSTKRITAIIAGTGGGKTATIPLWIMRQLEKKPDAEIIVVAPTFSMLRQATVKEIKRAFEGFPDLDFTGRFNKHDSELHLPSGAVIYFRSAEDPDSIQGIHADACVVDECGKAKSGILNVARQRTTRKGGPILLTSTPYGFNWLYHDVYVPWREGDKSIEVINFKAVDNPTVSKTEVEYERKKLPDWKFRQMFLGEFTRPAGAVYPDLRDCVISSGELPRVKPDVFIGGFDFGFNDPSAALVGFVHDDVLYLVYEKYMSGKTTREFAKDLARDPMWFCDSSRPDSIKELRRMGFHARPCKKGAGSVADGIDRVNALINTGRLKIVEGMCPCLLNEGDLYAYKQGERENEFTDAPEDKNNHALDALRYLVQGCKRRRLLSDEPVTKELAA